MLANCKECGTLFNKISTEICNKCLDIEEEEYQGVRKYLEENPDALIDDVVEATGISVEKIRKFLEEGRLTETKFVIESDIVCQVCGRAISTGNLCKFCAKKVAQGLSGEKETMVDEDVKKEIIKSKEKDGGMYTKPYLKDL